MIDGVSNTLVTILAVGDGPTAVAVNELTNRIYVGNANDKTLSVIDGAMLSLAATLSLPLRATFLSVAAQVSRLYTSSGNAPDHSGVIVISDEAGTFAALRQAIIAATIGDPPGIRNSLLAKVDSAAEALAKGNNQAAVNKLRALANEVEAQRGKRLTNAEADRILALLAALLNSIA